MNLINLTFDQIYAFMVVSQYSMPLLLDKCFSDLLFMLEELILSFDTFISFSIKTSYMP